MNDIKNDVGYYILAGLTVTLGLAWNEAIASGIEHYFPFDRDGLLAKFAYAIILTLGIVLVARYVFKGKPKNPASKK